MRLWIVQVQGSNRHWIPWGFETSEAEADACADNTNRMTGWEVRVEEFAPAEMSRSTYDAVLHAALLAADDHGIPRREFVASLQKHGGFKTLDKRFRAEMARPIPTESVPTE